MTNKSVKLSKNFYLRENVVEIAQELLGKTLCTNINGALTKGKIVETEAYSAPEDPASHAFNNRKTPRTQMFFAEGGTAYIYLIYGVYKLFNVITNVEGVPHAILIRAIEPTFGVETMMQRRNLSQVKRNLTGGPGLVSLAMGIGMEYNGLDLNSEIIWIEEGEKIAKENIIASPRVGMGKNVFEPYFTMPWRFRIKNNPFTSPAK